MEHIGAQEVGGGAANKPSAAKDGSAPLQPFLGEEFAESVINALPGSFFVVSQDGRMVRWNRNFEFLSGYSRSEVATLNILDFVVREHRERAAKAMARVLAEGGEEIEVDCRTRDGRVLPFYMTGRRACIGGATYIIGTGFDITQRKQAEQKLADERNLLRTLIDNIPDAIYVKDRESRFVLCNREVLRRKAVGSLEEITGRSDFDFYPAELAESVYAHEQEVMRTGRPLLNDERCVMDRATGRPTWNLTTKVPLRNAAGEVVGLVGIGRDITERKQANESLRQSNEQFRKIFENAVLGLYRTTPEGRILMANPSLVHMLGYSSFEELAGLNVETDGYLAGCSRAAFKQSVESQGQVVGMESAWKRRDGTALFVRQNARVIRDEQGNILYYEGTVEDITEWKRAQKRLEGLQDIINRSPVLVFMWRVVPGQWPVLFVSGNVEQSLGYTGDDFLSGRVSWPGITHPDDVPRLEAEVARHLAEGRREWSQEYRLITKSGEVRWFTDQNLALSDADGTVTRIQSIVLDITERKRMEDALCETERKYRDLYEGSRDGTVATDLAGKILHCNSVFLNMLGYRSDEMAALTYREIMPAKRDAGQDRVIREQVFARGYSDVHEEECVRKDGSVFPVEVRLHLSMDNASRPIGLWALVRDITDRKQAEAQARQHLAELTRAWHANTIGEMASGLAHELNQPLCAILNYSNGCLRLSRREQFSIDTLQTSIEQIATQARRAADIVKRIRGLIAKREPQRAELDLEGLVNDTVHLLQSEAAESHVAIVAKFARDLPRAKGDRVEIAQVLLNLMRNAIEAMSDVDVTGRVLTISGAPSRERDVEVAVADVGRGVAPELAEQIFESFFTTKDQGLGIGLSLSRRIIESHGGRLWVESDGRSGATFRFTLPSEGAAHGEG